MGKATGFKEYNRTAVIKRPVEKRIKDFKEVYEPQSEENLKMQAARCMDCGTPFCNWSCPLGNLSPDFNHMVYKGQWEKAFRRLILTSSFPEFTGRVCPALCEGSCTLGVNREPVTVRELELSIIEKAFKEGWVKSAAPRVRTGKTTAIVGSGPSGLSAADRLNSLGHKVTVFERADKLGGLLRYGIPDFKLEKWVLDRRLRIMEQNGILFRTRTNIGADYSTERLLDSFDSILLTGGSTVPRDIKVEGRDLDGIFFAVDYLACQNKKVSGEKNEKKDINAKGKTVLVIGGGDTGSDCVGTAIRQGAKNVYQFEIMPKPPEVRDETMPWPSFPGTLKTTTSHEEGCTRDWSISTKKIEGADGKVKSIHAIRVQWEKDPTGKIFMQELPGTEFELAVDMILLSMGFLHPEQNGIIEALKLKVDTRGNVYTDDNYMTSKSGVFSAGDMRTGQSLVVRAISDGRQAAKNIDEYLMKL